MLTQGENKDAGQCPNICKALDSVIVPQTEKGKKKRELLARKQQDKNLFSHRPWILYIRATVQK